MDDDSNDSWGTKRRKARRVRHVTPEDQILELKQTSIETEWMYPPQLPMVEPIEAVAQKLDELQCGLVHQAAHDSCRANVKAYGQVGGSSVMDAVSRMSAFDAYNAAQQDMFCAYYMNEVSVMVNEAFRAGRGEQGVYEIVRATIPPMIYKTQMGVVCAASYAARVPSGEHILFNLLQKPDIFDDLIAKAGPAQSEIIRNMRDNADYGKCSRYVPRLQGSYSRREPVRPIECQPPPWVAAMRGNEGVINYFISYQFRFGGHDAALHGLTTLEACDLALATYQAAISCDPRSTDLSSPPYPDRVRNCATAIYGYDVACGHDNFSQSGSPSMSMGGGGGAGGVDRSAGHRSHAYVAPGAYGSQGGGGGSSSSRPSGGGVAPSGFVSSSYGSAPKLPAPPGRGGSSSSSSSQSRGGGGGDYDPYDDRRGGGGGYDNHYPYPPPSQQNSVYPPSYPPSGGGGGSRDHRSSSSGGSTSGHSEDRRSRSKHRDGRPASPSPYPPPYPPDNSNY